MLLNMVKAKLSSTSRRLSSMAVTVRDKDSSDGKNSNVVGRSLSNVKSSSVCAMHACVCDVWYDH